MFDLYEEIFKSLKLIEEKIDFNNLNIDELSNPPTLKRQVTIKYEVQHKYNLYKYIYDELKKKNFIVEHFNFNDNSISNQDLNLYHNTINNLDILNPDYNTSDNFYKLDNILDTIKNKNNKIDIMVEYFEKKNKEILENIYKEYNYMINNMKRLKWID